MGKWKPVKDGTHETQHNSCKVIVQGEWLSVKDDLYDISVEAALPDDLRLCRLVPDEGSVPSDIAAILRALLHASIEGAEIGLDDFDWHDLAAQNIEKYKAALAWLSQQQKGGE